MNRKIAKSLSALLLITAIAVTQVPVSDVEAVATASDFEMDGNKLMRYSGTDEVVSVPDGISEIGEEAFAGNDNLIKVEIGSNVKSIGYRAFAECDNLRTITVGDQVEEIGTAAFSNNKELVNVNLGAGVKKIGTGVFAGSGQLKEVSVSEDNPYLHYSNGILYDSEETKVYALMPAYEKGAYTLPSTVKEITGYAFWGNPYLEKVTLGSGLTEVPAYAFSNCQNLKEVEIPLTIRGIGAKAFEDCVNLARVTLPDSMANIHATAFDGCPNVEFEAALGTYGAEFAAAFKTSEVDEVEYEDVQDSQVIDVNDISEEGSGSSAGTSTADVPAPTPAGTSTTDVPASTPGGSETDASENSTSQEPAPEENGNEEAAPVPTLGTVTETFTNRTLLGQSSIVSGRAVIFIDNRQSTVLSGNTASDSSSAGASSGQIDLSSLENILSGLGIQTGADEDNPEGTSQASGRIENLLVDNAQKGKDFPKYTIVDDTRIASQAFYQDRELTDYEIGEGITEIGEFAFARSGLTSVTIPDGVTRIGYGAFYHCDSLEEVSIPNSVTEIEPYAFDKTPWLESNKKNNAYSIVGDGILIAYSGSESVVNIPNSVKQIAPGVFKEHMGITAVNLPAAVRVIGEEAFMNCRNLKTVNGGKQLEKVKDRAFMNCPLSQVEIPATVEEIGLGAYAISGGTDIAVFTGNELPVLSVEQSARRLANQEYRTYAFDTIKNVIVPDDVTDLSGTILEAGTYGFNGIVSTESGTLLTDNRSGIPAESNSPGVSVRIESAVIPESENVTAMIPGNDGTYVLSVRDSEDAAEHIRAAYGALYGGREPYGLSAYEISLYDASGTIPITRLGRQSVMVQMKIPSNLSKENLHVVTLDQDGQLEAVENRILELEDGDYIQFTTSHFSPYGIYQYTGIDGQGVVSNGKAVITSLSGNKDATPDTGDFLHPKWFLALGLLAGAVALFFYKGKSKKNLTEGN